MELEQSPLLTDLYQLTMLQSYLDQAMEEEAVFEFFVRKLPPQRNFLIAAGLEQLQQFLLQARFSEEELNYLQQTGRFKSNLLDYLSNFRFSGSLHAMPEGTLCFANEPVARITAPLPQAQLVETRLINILQLQMLIASKAARCRLVAPQQQLIDFGLRRAHGAEAGLLAARACYLGGFDGSSNVLAGQRFGIPIMGTMAHSYIQAHRTEREAFRHFANSLPDHVVLLIDTYDTRRGAQQVLELVPELASQSISVKAVRIDSGDLLTEAQTVRSLFDQHHCQHIRIMASSSIDEYVLEQLIEQQAPIDGYGIGTNLTTSADSPFLNCAYKLQEYAGIPRRKRSSGKATWPGRKQVFRVNDDAGLLQYDWLCCEDEQPESGQALLTPVIENGQPTAPLPSLDSIRQSLIQNLGSLPPPLRSLKAAPAYPLQVSQKLQDMAAWVDQRFGSG